MADKIVDLPTINIEDLDRWEEVHNGKIVKMEPLPLEPHQIITFNIIDPLKHKLRNHVCRVYGSGAGVGFNDNINLVPDVLVIKDLSIITEEGINAAPDLVAEVLSPNTEELDRGYKKDMYEQYGVKEYWLVDQQEQSVEVYYLQDEKLTLSNKLSLANDDIIKLSIFDDNIELSLGDIFKVKK